MPILLTETIGLTVYSATCSATAAKEITITNLPNIAAKSIVNFRIYSEFLSGITTPGITTAATYQTVGGLKIDETTTAIGSFQITFASIVKVTQDFGIFLTN
jgi:hypothetical protein